MTGPAVGMLWVCCRSAGSLLGERTTHLTKKDPKMRTILNNKELSCSLRANVLVDAYGEQTDAQGVDKLWISCG